MAEIIASLVWLVMELLLVGTGSDLSENRGTLAYRFGVPGHIELEFPRRGTPSSAKQFRYAHYSRYQVDRTEITFNVGEYSYSVFSYYDGEVRPSTSEGVRVSRGKKESALSCVGGASANFTGLESAVPCDSENALAMCR
jgi:hypothetical protein